ncbi:hypothetical protein [Nocardia huaxiensis]|uniref:Uncharacterized protein n=1 Tax=Nocardia huaxiensis TaxID=2755382 RepID=A0A7D6VES4_9NOCA|nr:hypothetical protein [Nocardia huaxiensis]QLY32702.1 hypothetical protein H0264_11005 [Nocardia huaxiensis]UFS93561.1 hypothetical protein LPY97_22370 [Nocardia huaxiensis]
MADRPLFLPRGHAAPLRQGRCGYDGCFMVLDLNATTASLRVVTVDSATGASTGVFDQRLA